MDNIDFGIGKIVCNVFNIDFEKTIIGQEDSLTEDLIQVEYPGNYLLDIGWYPEYDCKVKFIINIIHNYNWDKPVYKKNASNKKELYHNLNEAINLLKIIL